MPARVPYRGSVVRFLAVAAAVVFLGLVACTSDNAPLPTAPTTPTVVPGGVINIQIRSNRPRRVVPLGDVVVFSVFGNFVAGGEQPVVADLSFQPQGVLVSTGREGTYVAAMLGEVVVSARFLDAARALHVDAQTFTVRQTAPVPDRLQIEGWPYDGADGLPVGDTLRLSAVAVYPDGVRDSRVDGAWLSSDPDVASVGVTGGLVTAHSAGSFALEVRAFDLVGRLRGLRVVGVGGGSTEDPTVRVSCDPCRVVTYDEVRLTADAVDPEGERLDVEWTATRGAFAAPGGFRVSWYSGAQPGRATITVTVTDPHGASASDSVVVRVNAPDPGTPLPEHPAVQEYATCDLMHEAGWDRGVRSAGGSYRSSWSPAERATYAHNWRHLDPARTARACPPTAPE